MKATFLMSIYTTKNITKNFNDVFKSAMAHGFKMFVFNGDVYSCETVAMRIDKQYAEMTQAILFKMTELI